MVCAQSRTLRNSESSFGAQIDEMIKSRSYPHTIMRERKMKRIATLIALAVIVSGCTTGNPQPTHPTPEEMIRAGEKMISMMITDRQFLKRSYPRIKRLAKERGENLPRITVERVIADCHEKLRVTECALTPVREGLRVALRKTDMFSVEDEREYVNTVDYGLKGELISSDDDRIFFLRLRLIDYTDDKNEVWNEFQRVETER